MPKGSENTKMTQDQLRQRFAEISILLQSVPAGYQLDLANTIQDMHRPFSPRFGLDTPDRGDAMLWAASQEQYTLAIYAEQIALEMGQRTVGQKAFKRLCLVGWNGLSEANRKLFLKWTRENR